MILCWRLGTIRRHADHYWIIYPLQHRPTSTCNQGAFSKVKLMFRFVLKTIIATSQHGLNILTGHFYLIESKSYQNFFSFYTMSHKNMPLYFTILHYNSGISWWICILYVPKETGMNTLHNTSLLLLCLQLWQWHL